MESIGSQTVDGVKCDMFNNPDNNATAWFKAGTNILFQADLAAQGLTKYSKWQATLNASEFEVKPEWHCPPTSDPEGKMPMVKMN
jgi:hypothetical protein